MFSNPNNYDSLIIQWRLKTQNILAEFTSDLINSVIFDNFQKDNDQTTTYSHCKQISLMNLRFFWILNPPTIKQELLNYKRIARNPIKIL